MARLLRVHLQLDAQRADEVVDRSRRALVLRPPAARKDVVAAEGAAVRGEEEPQHLELLRADVQLGALAGDDLAVEVDLHLPEPDDRVLLGRSGPAPQERFHPRQELPPPTLLSNSMWPPCSSTSFLAMASPRPVPSVRRESRSSAR